MPAALQENTFVTLSMPAQKFGLILIHAPLKFDNNCIQVSSRKHLW